MCAASVLTAGVAFAVAPVAAQAAAVNLGTAAPFVVLGGQSVTNTGPSVLNGELGVSPGTAISGFSPGNGIVNGATHNSDAVALQAQADLTTAYNVAAGEPATPLIAELGGRTLTAGAYSFSSSAQLTGAVTLDAQGNPNAQFVFKIGSTLTTAAASSVVLVNGASPCNIFWQVGSSATLDTTTSFQGNVMALTSITMNNGATAVGRMLARNGSVVLNNNVLSNGGCGTGPTPTPTGTTPGSGTGTGDGTGSDDEEAATTRNGTARLRRIPSEVRTPAGVCTDGFHGRVRGAMIERVVFSMDGKRIGTRTRGPYTVNVRSASLGRHVITARVTFRDATRARTLTMRYRACGFALARLNPRQGPSRFTG